MRPEDGAVGHWIGVEDGYLAPPNESPLDIGRRSKVKSLEPSVAINTKSVKGKIRI